MINPSFDVNAITDVNGVKIQMFASGRLTNIKFEFTSHPAMPENEILSLLAIGLSSMDTKKLSAVDQSTVQQNEAASLVLHSLDFNRDLEDKTGFQVQLDEGINTRQGVSAFQPQSQGNSIMSPQITIRRKLVGDRLSLSAGKTVGVGSNQMTQMVLDYTVNQHISVMGVYNNYTTGGSTGTLDNLQNPNNNSLGMDIKLQKRFK